MRLIYHSGIHIPPDLEHFFWIPDMRDAFRYDSIRKNSSLTPLRKLAEGNSSRLPNDKEGWQERGESKSPENSPNKVAEPFQWSFFRIVKTKKICLIIINHDRGLSIRKSP